MKSARVLVDADSCPLLVRKYLISYTKKLNVELIFVANKNIPSDGAGKNFSMQICPKESGAADKWILENCAEYDVIVTRDIPLAAALIGKCFCVMNDRGTVFCAENIGRRLKERELGMQMSELGIGTKRRSAYSKKEFAEFAKTFDRKIHKLV
ncbi:MAG: DUF188 domain-containing protein [Treponemataceae bacterium]|nr:DUF188 domain-containing protein [Treponemataceae bacterium]